MACVSWKGLFEGVRLEEIHSADEWPAREAVRTFGPASRHPAAGGIYVHIEGQPCERGYQHGHLMAPEIPEYLERCAAVLGSKDHWDDYRTMANALFLRGFDREILEKMHGIAEGASDAGARWLDRRIDLLDIVVANTTVEMGELASTVSTTPTGLEGLSFDAPAYVSGRRDSGLEHCSAFAATGPATRNGKMVIGHVTWWPLTLAEQTNVILDIKPASCHRMLIQSYPRGIESGTDWYQNDVGVVLTEATIGQTPFNPRGRNRTWGLRLFLAPKMGRQYRQPIPGTSAYKYFVAILIMWRSAVGPTGRLGCLCPERHISKGDSKTPQERHEPFVRRPPPHRCCRSGVAECDGFGLGFQIHCGIDVGSVDGNMAEPIANSIDVQATAE
jgi:Phospholipase B